jgi:pyrroline-5-carboxylate reductase
VGIEGTIGFLGFGNMGQAIFRGLIDAGTVPPECLVAFDIDEAKTTVAARSGGRVAPSAETLASDSDVILLATKPQHMESALEAIRPGLSSDTLIISIAAGISIAFIQHILGKETHVARVMPNTPALVRAGTAAIATSDSCTSRDAQTAEAIFTAVGIAERTPEDLIDAVTGLSGSGPAYFFYLVECLANAAAELGMPAEQAERFAGETLYGAGRLLHDSGESAATLRERVTSKGGTTAAALESFRQAGLEKIVENGVRAAMNRSKELAK